MSEVTIRIDGADKFPLMDRVENARHALTAIAHQTYAGTFSLKPQDNGWWYLLATGRFRTEEAARAAYRAFAAVPQGKRAFVRREMQLQSERDFESNVTTYQVSLRLHFDPAQDGVWEKSDPSREYSCLP